MIKFRTEVELPEIRKKMSYRHQSLMIGSCFTENIGNYLQERCMPVLVNPFGILYNPFSIANSLELVLSHEAFTEHDLFFSNNLYNSFSHHSRFSGPDRVKVLEQINLEAEEALNHLNNATHLFITFGTSWIFQDKQTGRVVSNCHKLPAATFNHHRLSVDQITEIWIPLIEQLRIINPKLHLVFTVSPIRHLKDGAHENLLSKSTLLMAIEALILKYGNNLITYFPAYEIMVDELRDYRYYAKDMTHLSDLAVDFIREKMVETILDTEAQDILNEIDHLISALNHKPFNPLESSYQSFIESQLGKIDLLRMKYPFINFAILIRKFHEKKIH